MDIKLNDAKIDANNDVRYSYDKYHTNIQH